MAASKVTYGDKVGIVPKTVHINQVWDDDMNEIKLVVNDNADLFDLLETEVDTNTLDIVDLQNEKAIKHNIVNTVSDYFAAAGDYVLVSTGAPSSVTITLQFSKSFDKGKEINITKFNNEPFDVIINTTSAQLINGLLTQTIDKQYTNMTVVSTGSGWVIK